MPNVTMGSDWSPRVIADFNGDGRPDIVWQNHATGAVWFWFMDMFARIGEGPASPVGSPWRLVGAR
jgi:hypothetical protein